MTQKEIGGKTNLYGALFPPKISPNFLFPLKTLTTSRHIPSSSVILLLFLSFNPSRKPIKLSPTFSETYFPHPSNTFNLLLIVYLECKNLFSTSAVDLKIGGSSSCHGDL